MTTAIITANPAAAIGQRVIGRTVEGRRVRGTVEAVNVDPPSWRNGYTGRTLLVRVAGSGRGRRERVRVPFSSVITPTAR
jgi:L-rhamnose isomerase